MGIFHTHVVLPLVEPDGHSGLGGRLRQIRRFERLSPSHQRNVQHDRLQRLLTHAYYTVPFYRKQFDDAGVHPSQIRPGDPIPIAVTTPDIVRERSHAMISAAYRLEDLRIATGGTMRSPSTSRHDRRGLRDRIALNLQLNTWAGFNPGDSVMTLSRMQDTRHLPSTWRSRLYEEVLLRRTDAASDPTADELLEHARIRYEKRAPKVLYGASTTMAAFAAYIAAHGMRHRPQVVIATAEALNDDDRIFIESVFGTRLYVQHGVGGIGTVGAECHEHEGLHLHPWGTYVEFDPVGDTPDGPAYRLLATDLLNHGQPLIRYDTGDVVTMTEQMCSCGRCFPMVRNVLSRLDESVGLDDGGILPAMTIGRQMTQLCQNFRAVSRVQVVQKADRHLHLRYVVKENGPAESHEIQSVCNSIDALLRRPMRWTMERVNDIPRELSGKIRLCKPDAPTAKSVLTLPQATSPREVDQDTDLTSEVRAS